jgi:hypothetical protein
MDKALRTKYYNRCNPEESLLPEDKRNVDIDEENSEIRGLKWIEALATRIELSAHPVCEFFSGLPGSGKSTELKRLSRRLRAEEGAHLLPVLIDAEDVLDIYNPIDIPDILMAIVQKTDEEVLKAEGKPAEEALSEGRVSRFWHWLTSTEVTADVEVGAEAKVGLSETAEVSAGAKLVLDMKTNPSLRKVLRERVAAQMTTFVTRVREEITNLDKRAKKLGYAGLVVIFDSLEKLRGISTNWPEVLESAERVFTGGAPYLELPVHAVYTLPPAVVLRLNVQVEFLPMLKLYDREGNRFEPGFKAAREIIRKRVPDKVLTEIFSAPSREDRIERLIQWSGGYPREIVRLLQTFVMQPSLNEALFKRLLALAGDNYRRTVPEEAYEWLAKVAFERKELAVANDEHRELVDRLLQNNVVLRYQNDTPWVDVHPAVREIAGVRDALARLEAKQAEKERAARDAHEKAKRGGGEGTAP